MGTSTFETQLTGAAAHIIKRPRLTKILDETEARIILLCAPAGYGKTTLAREWVATRSEPVYWYSGGPAMADVAALAVELVAAVHGSDAPSVQELRKLAARTQSVRALAKSVTTSLPNAHSILVIDDFHHAGDEPAANELLRDLATASTCRLLIASRARPKWIDSRSQMYGKVAVLTVDDLAFSEDEAAAVLPSRAELRERAGGWPAVIGLAAMRQTLEGLKLGLDRVELYDFLADDMLGATPAGLRADLFRLAAGADETSDVARDVLGWKFDEAIQAALDRGFLSRRDGWIAMHPLLREFLLRRASELDRQVREPLVAGVLRALSAHKRFDAALALLRRFPDGPVGVSLMRQCLGDLLAVGRTTTVERWVEWADVNHVPDPIFILARGESALRRGRATEARTLSEEAARSLDGDLAAQAFLAAGRAAHQLEDAAATAANARRAQKIADGQELRTEALWLEFVSAYERDSDQLDEALGRLRQLDDRRPEHALRLACAEAFASIGPTGSALVADDAARRAVALSLTVRDPYLRTNALNLRAHMLRALARYTDALGALEPLREEADRSGLDFVTEHALITEAGSLIGLRSVSAARDVLRRLESHEATMTHHVRGNLAMMKARLRITAGDLEGAASALTIAPPELPIALVEEFENLRYLIRSAREPHETVERAAANDEAPQYLEALATFNLAETISLVRTFKLTSDDVARRVKHWLSRGCGDAVVIACRAFPGLAAEGVSGGAATELLQLFAESNDHDLARRAGLRIPRETRRLQPLTNREREVLELLVSGRSNPEIAKTLFISPSTAKVHVKHIFEKLGVRSRAEAAAVFRDSV